RSVAGGDRFDALGVEPLRFGVEDPVDRGHVVDADRGAMLLAGMGLGGPGQVLELLERIAHAVHHITVRAGTWIHESNADRAPAGLGGLGGGGRLGSVPGTSRKRD